MILYLDSNPLIYSIAAKARFREPTLRWLDWHAAQPDATIVTSQLTVLESLVGVLKRNDAALRSELGRVLDAMMVLDVDSVIAERAAAIRASSQHRTPDAIHLATALTCESPTSCGTNQPRSSTGPNPFQGAVSAAY